MSADNYFLICKRKGRYVVVMGFESDRKRPRPCKTDPSFDRLSEAVEYAESQYTEYGTCWTPAVREDFRKAGGEL